MSLSSGGLSWSLRKVKLTQLSAHSGCFTFPHRPNANSNASAVCANHCLMSFSLIRLWISGRQKLSLSCSWCYLWHLPRGLALWRFSVNICCMNEWGLGRTAIYSTVLGFIFRACTVFKGINIIYIKGTTLIRDFLSFSVPMWKSPNFTFLWWGQM